jgi:hypothetical protein
MDGQLPGQLVCARNPCDQSSSNVGYALGGMLIHTDA